MILGETQTMRTILTATLAALGTLALGVAISGPALAQFGGPPAPPNTGVPLFAKLTGALGHGNATVVIDPPKGTACHLVNVSGLEGITVAHIHAGGPGESGRPVVTLETPEDGAGGGCAPIAADLSAAILANPGAFYVNVHTTLQPTGAIRGQLAM